MKWPPTQPTHARTYCMQRSDALSSRAATLESSWKREVEQREDLQGSVQVGRNAANCAPTSRRSAWIAHNGEINPNV